MIEIVDAELINDEYWSCLLEIVSGQDEWMLPATAPGTMDEGDLQAHFDAREDELQAIAVAKQYTVDTVNIFERVPLKRLLKAFALVILDEINILRVEAGLSERTAKQLVNAIKAKLKE